MYVLDHSTASGLFGSHTNDKFCFTNCVPPTEEGKTIVNGRTVPICQNDAGSLHEANTEQTERPAKCPHRDPNTKLHIHLSPLRSTCPAHLIFLDMIEWNLVRSTNHESLRYPETSRVPFNKQNRPNLAPRHVFIHPQHHASDGDAKSN